MKIEIRVGDHLIEFDATEEWLQQFRLDPSKAMAPAIRSIRDAVYQAERLRASDEMLAMAGGAQR